MPYCSEPVEFAGAKELGMSVARRHEQAKPEQLAQLLLPFFPRIQPHYAPACPQRNKGNITGIAACLGTFFGAEGCNNGAF